MKPYVCKYGKHQGHSLDRGWLLYLSLGWLRSTICPSTDFSDIVVKRTCHDHIYMVYKRIDQVIFLLKKLQFFYKFILILVVAFFGCFLSDPLFWSFNLGKEGSKRGAVKVGLGNTSVFSKKYSLQFPCNLNFLGFLKKNSRFIPKMPYLEEQSLEVQ